MQTFFTISRECTACGGPVENQPRLVDRIGSFELSYLLCGGCAESRQGRCGRDLLPIDGTQPCFFCGQRPAG